MPVVQTNTVNVPGQVNQSAQAPTTQLSFRQICGEIQQWNPDAPPQMVERWANNSYRKLVDSRMWYGLMVKGQITVPQIYATGTVTVNNGSPIVTGTGTTWTNSMVGEQFRIGFTTPISTIIAVPTPTTLLLDLPWGAPNFTNAGYSIFQQLVTFGQNVKRVISVLNLIQGWQLRVDVPKHVLDVSDAWRNQVGFTQICSSAQASPLGVPQWELYPIPTSVQAFPFIAYVQPPDMNDANPFPYAFIRADIIVLGALPDALVFRGKSSKYYDPMTANLKIREFAMELGKAMMVDDNLYMKDLVWEYSQYPYAKRDAVWNQSHDADYPV